MKLIIAGGRDLFITNQFLDAIFDYHFPVDIYEEYPDKIVSGKCEGIDFCGEEWAKSRNISIKSFPADWKRHGKSAGPIRNSQMAEYADALLLIWDGKSRGSSSMKEEMEKLDKPIYEIIIKNS